MGRRGGGSRGFGGGGSRGFGGRSGGGGINRGGGFGRSPSSSNRGASGGMFRSPVRTRGYHRPFFRPYGRPFFGWGTRMGGGGFGGGCLTLPLALLLIVVFIAIASSIFTLPNDSPITRSTVRREPLPPGSVVETGYYTDELGWIQNPTRLTAGMSNFYRETGVQPYLYITDTINGSHSPTEEEVQEFAFGLYDELFTDEAHFLLIFFEYQGDYSTWYVSGAQANSVMDTEAADILLDYIDRYYYYDMTDDAFFSTAFNDAGKRIMTVTTSPWIPVLMVVVILMILLIAFLWWRNSKKQKNLEAQQTDQMLKTPLDTFGDDKVKDLADKYKDKD